MSTFSNQYIISEISYKIFGISSWSCAIRNRNKRVKYALAPIFRPLLPTAFSFQLIPFHISGKLHLCRVQLPDASGKYITSPLRLSSALSVKDSISFHILGIFQDHVALRPGERGKYSFWLRLLSFSPCQKAPSPFHTWGISPVRCS